MFEIYDDRINIVSYGVLVGGLTEEEFFSGCLMPRNRELMRVFRDMELVENFGSGMHRILQAYDRSIFKISENTAAASSWPSKYTSRNSSQASSAVTKR